MFRIVDLIIHGSVDVCRVAFSVMQLMSDKEAKAGKRIDDADS